MPPILAAIKAPLDRGVRLRLLINGAQSMDEPSVAGLMLMAAKKVREWGGELYVKSGRPGARRRSDG